MSSPSTTQTGKLTRRNHPSLDAARWELVQHGYYPLHIRPDERREQWRKLKGGPVLTIGREDRPRSQLWHIVELDS